MKAESTVMPVAPYEVTFDGEFAEVLLLENVIEVPGENDEPTKYVWDEYRIRVKNRAGLVEDIERGFDVWLQAAKDFEYSAAAAEVRKKRNALLQETDYIMLPDYILCEEKHEVYEKYRQALRDITEQSGFPFKVIYPVKPT